MSAESVVENFINNAVTVSKQATEKAIAYTDQAQTAAQGWITSSPPSITEPTVPPFPAFPPDLDLASEFNRIFNQITGLLGPGLQDQINGWIAKFFPNINGCVQTASDAWICNALTNGANILPAAIENAIWDRGREREALTAYAQKQSAIEGWAARGWSAPGGALLDTLDRIDQDLADKVSSINRDIAIKQYQTAIENQRVAAQLAVHLRLGVLAALHDYLRAWLDVYKTAASVAGAVVDAHAKLWQAVEAYYRALIAAVEIPFEFQKLRSEHAYRFQSLDIEAFKTRIHGQVEAAVASADALAKIASSALGSQNSLATLENITNEGI